MLSNEYEDPDNKNVDCLSQYYLMLDSLDREHQSLLVARNDLNRNKQNIEYTVSSLNREIGNINTRISNMRTENNNMRTEIESLKTSRMGWISFIIGVGIIIALGTNSFAATFIALSVAAFIAFSSGS